jgi:DNA invertase Pin-like site-specific DNA recombinase
MDGRFVAYYRVSTERQGQSGLGLEAQKAAVETWLNGGRHTVVGEFVETESGKTSDRPQLKAALALAKKRKATLVIAKLDRLARNVHFISGLIESGVNFVAADRPHAKAFELHIFAAMAEEEGRAISERTKAALQAAKARGVKLGNPTNLDEASAKGAEALRAKAAARAENVLPILQDLRARGVSTLAELADALNARGVKTPRGGQWHPASVSRVLARAA